MISRLAIKNYRSLRDVELRPGPLTVLIGPNGAGKSNIIDALRFVKETYSDWTQAEVLSRSQFEERGGFGQAVWGGSADSSIRFEVEFSGNDDSSISDGLAIEVTEDRGRPYFVEQHHLVDSTPVGKLGEAVGRSAHISLGAKQTLDKLKRWQFYNFSPALMRKPTKVKQESLLNETGSNLSTVIHSLFSEGHPDLEEAVGMLKVMVPTVERLTSPIFGDGQTYVALKEKGVKQPIGAWGLSDGTLLALALSIALVVRPEPELICVESPEDGIHPANLEAVADLLEAASRETQVVVTTHSPHLLYWLPPECFVVVKKEAGKTNLYPLKDDAALQEIARELGAGEAFYSGFLEDVP